MRPHSRSHHQGVLHPENYPVGVACSRLALSLAPVPGYILAPAYGAAAQPQRAQKLPVAIFLRKRIFALQ